MHVKTRARVAPAKPRAGAHGGHISMPLMPLSVMTTRAPGKVSHVVPRKEEARAVARMVVELAVPKGRWGRGGSEGKKRARVTLERGERGCGARGVASRVRAPR